VFCLWNQFFLITQIDRNSATVHFYTYYIIMLITPSKKSAAPFEFCFDNNLQQISFLFADRIDDEERIFSGRTTLRSPIVDTENLSERDGIGRIGGCSCRRHSRCRSAGHVQGYWFGHNRFNNDLGTGHRNGRLRAHITHLTAAITGSRIHRTNTNSAILDGRGVFLHPLWKFICASALAQPARTVRVWCGAQI
jgi:hypothetical protein